MKKFRIQELVFLFITAFSISASASTIDTSGYLAGDTGLTPSEKLGRKIWFAATVGNDRFHAYVLPYRVGVYQDWYRVLGSEFSDTRFSDFGLIKDPDCCNPADPECAKRIPAGLKTYGYDYCPGDEELLKFVGKDGYKDPACDIVDPVTGEKDLKNCYLAFGTSTGVLGYRKFPNPRFDATRWEKIGGYKGYRKIVDGASRSHDNSIEKPFRVGISCGSCHVAYKPTNPPADPKNPAWENIDVAVGNQYLLFSKLFGAGMYAHSLESQVFTLDRPGTVDTSAIPNDQVNNPGTINDIMNLTQKVQYEETIHKAWKKDDGTYGPKETRTVKIPRILKGGEDSVGVKEAIVRVYVNIGMCSEACWVNRFMDMRQLNPTFRNYSQTPFDVDACRADCVYYGLMEKQSEHVGNFLFSRRPKELFDALAQEDKKAKPEEKTGVSDRESLRDYVESAMINPETGETFGEGATRRGQLLFTQNCASCHSSNDEGLLSEVADPRITHVQAALAANPSDVYLQKLLKEVEGKKIRGNWLGNDKRTPASEVGTFACRSLHSNHSKGQIYQEYGSNTLREQDAIVLGGKKQKPGRGYYRNLSLLSVWAHAPFMHNNAIGPEICGDPATYTPGVNGEETCSKFDPSVKGRLSLFFASVERLLTPPHRRPVKVTKTTEDIVTEVGPEVPQPDGSYQKLQIVIPKGLPVGVIGSFRHKEFIRDLITAKGVPGAAIAQLTAWYGEEGKRLYDLLKDIDLLRPAVDRLADREALKERVMAVMETYSNCLARQENSGHSFGTDLTDQEKSDLTAFLLLI